MILDSSTFGVIAIRTAPRQPTRNATAIVEATTKFRTNIVAFTSAYGETGKVDERLWAKRTVARHASFVLNEVDAAREEWRETLNKVEWHVDGPRTSPAVFPLWEIMKAARKPGVTVWLESQGADEMFGGYSLDAATACVEECLSMLWHPRALCDALSSVRKAATAYTLQSLVANSVVSDQIYELCRRSYGLIVALHRSPK